MSVKKAVQKKGTIIVGALFLIVVSFAVGWFGSRFYFSETQPELAQSKPELAPDTEMLKQAAFEEGVEAAMQRSRNKIIEQTPAPVQLPGTIRSIDGDVLTVEFVAAFLFPSEEGIITKKVLITDETIIQRVSPKSSDQFQQELEEFNSQLENYDGSFELEEPIPTMIEKLTLADLQPYHKINIRFSSLDPYLNNDGTFLNNEVDIRTLDQAEAKSITIIKAMEFVPPELRGELEEFDFDNAKFTIELADIPSEPDDATVNAEEDGPQIEGDEEAPPDDGPQIEGDEDLSVELPAEDESDEKAGEPFTDGVLNYVEGFDLE